MSAALYYSVFQLFCSNPLRTGTNVSLSQRQLGHVLYIFATCQPRTQVMDYYWKLFQKSWTLSLCPSGIAQFFPFLRGRSLSFGFWMKFSADAVPLPPSKARMEEKKHALYMPLEKNTIRLFVLHPGRDSEPICGHLVHNKLSWKSEVGYEALSYVWGDSNNTSMVTIDGCESSVTRNLESALHHLRSEEHPRTIWIDTICINQSDVLERNAQVRLMGLIYEKARNVNIWLGTETPDSAIGIEILSYLATNTDPTSDPPWQKYPPCLVQAGLNDIMSRDWFQRIWVVQEAAVSQMATMLCGHYQFSWTHQTQHVRHFIRMIKFAEISPQWQQAGLGHVKMNLLLELLDLQIGQRLDKSWGQTYRPAPDLLDITHGMRHRASTDPRDKIFALLGVAVAQSVEDFDVDYTMTVEEAYRHLRSKLRPDSALNLEDFEF